MRATTSEVFAVEESEPVEKVIDRTIEGSGEAILLWIYLPEGEGPLAATMFFHGGGFVSGGLNSHDEFCRTLANTVGIAVVAVDYRLAPEHPFSAAVEDAYAATE